MECGAASPDLSKNAMTIGNVNDINKLTDDVNLNVVLLVTWSFEFKDGEFARVEMLHCFSFKPDTAKKR